MVLIKLLQYCYTSRWSTFGDPTYALRRRKYSQCCSHLHPLVSRYASHLYRNDFRKNLGDWGHRGLSCRSDSARIFPISRQKVTYRKTHWKTECSHRIFPPNFSPNFRCVCFSAVRTQPENPSQRRAKSRVQMWQGWKPLNMPFWEAKMTPKNWKFLQLAVLHLSAFQDWGYRDVLAPSSTGKPGQSVHALRTTRPSTGQKNIPHPGRGQR